MLQLITTGTINCDDGACPYKDECANHVTASRHRAENGFSPQVTVRDRDALVDALYSTYGKVAICTSRNTNPIYSSYGTFPINHEELGLGKVSYDFHTGKLSNQYDERRKWMDAYRDYDDYYERSK